MRPITHLSLVVTLGLTACSQTDGQQDSATPAPVVEEAAATETPSPLPTSTTTPLIRGLPQTTPLTLTTATSGVGPRPVLAWEAMDGAALYSVVVHDADGVPYWGWETEDTEVRLGLTERPVEAPGPRITEGMTWSVVAHDREGVPVAASEVRPIAP